MFLFVAPFFFLCLGPSLCVIVEENMPSAVAVSIYRPEAIKGEGLLLHVSTVFVCRAAASHTTCCLSLSHNKHFCMTALVMSAGHAGHACVVQVNSSCHWDNEHHLFACYVNQTQFTTVLVGVKCQPE